MSFNGEICPHCGKSFRFKGSMAKYHDPCPKSGQPSGGFNKSAQLAGFEAIAVEAEQAGLAAAQAHTPTPMLVVEHTNPLNDLSPIKTIYEPVMGGVCGFAEIIVKPATTSIAHFLAKRYERKQGQRWGDEAGGLSSGKHYYGGLSLWVGAFNQSMELKEQFARAYARVLQAHGITCYATSRMD